MELYIVCKLCFLQFQVKLKVKARAHLLWVGTSENVDSAFSKKKKAWRKVKIFLQFTILLQNPVFMGLWLFFSYVMLFCPFDVGYVHDVFLIFSQ